MSNLTIRQAVQGMLKLQDSGDHATMVGIGPMSPNLIQAVFELAKDEDFPPMFIASRNQVDMDEMGAGYVNGWDQTRFAADIKKVADANLYERQRAADADAYAQVKAAEARAQIAAQEAEATRLRAQAESDAVRLAGQARAEAIEAEAEALSRNQEALLAQIAVVYLPLLQHAFGTATLGWQHWLVAAGCGALVILVEEAAKAVRRARG